ncbi:MAG: hypothetical protein HQ528_04985 [Candidatus Marinimicrobia bacterium]|nr:hypothetical protein [Candidatus Neomarinimicrobiota bacterium]
MNKILSLIIFAGLTVAVVAQEAPVPPAPPEKTRQMEMMAIWRLTEKLKLTTEQAETFFPMMREHKDQIRLIDKERRELAYNMLEKAERGENIPDKEFRKLVDEITGLGKRKIDIRVDYLNQLEGLLTNTQRVKLLVFEDQFRNELKKNVFDRRAKAESNKRMMGKYKRDAKRY